MLQLPSDLRLPSDIAGRLAYADLVISDGPSAYWRMGEPSGSVLDSIGTAHGTVAGTVTRDVAGGIVDDDGAILFDGSTGKVTVTDQASLDLGDVFTIEVWCKRTTLTADVRRFVSKGTNAYSLAINAADQIRLDKDGVDIIVESTVGITDTTTWHHVVVTKSGATVVQWLDSVNVTGTVSNLTFTDTAVDLRIAVDFGGTNQFWDGRLDELALYKRALSAAEVLEHYQVGSGT